MLKLAFLGAWLTPLLLVLQYRLVRVPARLKEIQQVLFKRPDPGRPAPIEHYVQLFDVAGANETAIAVQFLRYYRWAEFLPALALFTASSAGGLWLIYCRVAHPETLPYSYGTETVLALAGAYVWSLYEILNRRASRDLTADELYSIAIRFLIAIPIGRAASVFAGESAKASLAFAVTAFPLRDLNRLLRRRALKKLGAEIPSDRTEREGLLTECVDGIDPATVTRLEELNITTHTNLAYADPVRLMAQTGYPLRMIVQWMDHALLAVYALPYKKKLKDAGLPCSLDVKEFYEAHFACVEDEAGNPIPWRNRSIAKCDALEALEKKLGIKRELIREIFQRVASDPQVRFLATLWYTGYMPKDCPKLPKCPHHEDDLASLQPARRGNTRVQIHSPAVAVVVPDPEPKP